ncbi:methyl-accepting chemotaxis protein [Rhizorhabdus sp. FW153]|uniref:methyl-accepting chemotaxis protein n=1 Tax=Rhizorhabdus sp. FW153 TaxID=3400216 RepID=UPI003CF48911
MSFDMAIMPARVDERLRPAMITRSVGAESGVRDVIACFRDCPELEALPVVDGDGRPLGAVLERDVRRLLLNPFGHALLCNHSLYRRLDGFVSAVPVAEADAPLGELFALVSSGEGHDAILLTREGRFVGAVSGRTLLRLAADREAELGRRRAARLRRIAEASSAMRAEAAALSGDMMEVSSALEESAGRMGARARDVGAKGLSVMTAAAQAADNVGAVAEQGRELVASLGQLSSEVAAARSSTLHVAGMIEEGGRRARQLGETTDEIGAVVETIDAVARRINLLALNATIEAARAGEAGRGFAIVASEVKALARQTRDSVGLIAARIDSVRSGVGSVAAGQAGIEAAIAALDDLSATVDAAVERNRKVGEAVSANVRDAAGANEHIRTQASEISGSAADAASGAEQISGIARSLTDGAARLRQRLGRFLDEIEEA